MKYNVVYMLYSDFLPQPSAVLFQLKTNTQIELLHKKIHYDIIFNF